jgi:hypothetical protein
MPIAASRMRRRVAAAAFARVSSRYDLGATHPIID